MSDQVTVRIRKSHLRIALVVLATAALVAPTAVWAADRFNDVPDSNTFHEDIAWMADNGITIGCNAAGDEYCPNDNVTRGQMAAFMRRGLEDYTSGLLPLATVSVNGNGVMGSEHYRDPVVDVVSSGSDGTYTLEVVGQYSSLESAVCTAVSGVDRAASISVAERSVSVFTWDISSAQRLSSGFTCTIYGN